MTDITLTPDQESRAARIKALTDEQRENVLFLLSVSDPARVEWALRSVESPSPDQVAFVLGALADNRRPDPTPESE
jgi:hypothetical protein